jgi:hypothetical protein
MKCKIFLVVVALISLFFIGCKTKAQAEKEAAEAILRGDYETADKLIEKYNL